MNGTSAANITTVFHLGDEVVLVQGSYLGTPGIFVRLTPDPAWAEISERNGATRSHPVVWLALR